MTEQQPRPQVVEVTNNLTFLATMWAVALGVAIGLIGAVVGLAVLGLNF